MFGGFVILNGQSSVLDDIAKEQKEDSDYHKVITTLLDEKFKRRKTILENRQVAKITTLDTLAQLYDIKFLKQWVDGYAEWRTSGDKGKGRQDIVDISKFHYAEMKDQRRELLDVIKRH